MKKIILVALLANILFAGWAYVVHFLLNSHGLDVFCESTIKLNNDREGTEFNFDGTIVARFKQDLTGYIGLLGVIDRDGKHYNVSREVSFTYEPKDEDGIYGVRPNDVVTSRADTAPNEMVERNIIGRPGVVSRYVVRHTNNNSWSIGNIYTPFMMCVDKKN
ncbi:hypothetical protein [Cedecea davisae]|uniref:hypothetical protein n=1 Tax=Cedecea davisae TaxID=158484 RepID=UPI00242E3557|nr:hypothetical protein [Cedecea davisae]